MWESPEQGGSDADLCKEQNAAWGDPVQSGEPFCEGDSEGLLDNTLPPSRRYRDDDLEDFQARRANEAALRAMGLEAIASPRSGSGSDSGFGGFGNTGFDPRPKATLKPRVTAKADKPYISKGISGLNQLAGLQKGHGSSRHRRNWTTR